MPDKYYEIQSDNIAFVDPHWCFENYEEAAEKIEKLMEHRDKLRYVLEKILNSGEWYSSALEMNREVNGYKLGQMIVEVLEMTEGKEPWIIKQ